MVNEWFIINVPSSNSDSKFSDTSLETHEQVATVPPDLAGLRLDHVLVRLFPDYSRARLQRWLEEGRVLIDGAQRRARDKLWGGERVALTAALEAETPWGPEPLPLTVVYQDGDIIVIDKPAGLVVHPGEGNQTGTLVNALLHHAPELAGVPRAGIVHRLDKDTSGLLVVARTLAAQKELVAQLQAHTVTREYDAIVVGELVAGGTVDAPVGRHPVDRQRMAVLVGESGKPAVTHYRVLERWPGHTHLRVHLETGRTHQIRVHMAHIRHPLFGDPVYGTRLRLPRGCDGDTAAVLRAFKRQALHAGRLRLEHPRSGEQMQWRSRLPGDMRLLVEAFSSLTRPHWEDAWDEKFDDE